MLRIFPVQIRSVARMDSLKSAWRDQAENPESYGLSFFVERRNRFLQRLIVRLLRFVKNLRRGRAFNNSHGIHRQDTTARIGTLPRSFVRSVKRSRYEWARVRIWLFDILPPGFGDADVATEHKQSNRRDRCRQRKDKPHGPGMSRTVRGPKGGQ